MKAGAADYLIKDELSPANLERSIRYSIERYNQKRVIESKEKKYNNTGGKGQTDLRSQWNHYRSP